MSDERQWYYFTFGCGQKFVGHYVKFYGTFDETRKKMFDEYGPHWAFQYSEAEWNAWVQKCKERGAECWIETELK